MRISIFITYIVFVIYTLIHLLFFFGDRNLFFLIFDHTANPMILMVFYLVALFSLSYLMVSMTYFKLELKDYVPLILGMFLGGYSIAPVMISLVDVKKQSKRFIKITSIILMIVTIFILVFGFTFGDFNNYVDAFLHDSFVHILTLDFIFLTVTSIFTLKPLTKHYYVGAIPIFGLLIGVLLEHE